MDVKSKRGGDSVNLAKIELRLFDGRMNETKDQAIQDFERNYGYNPVA
jgi:hypothetical protein